MGYKRSFTPQLDCPIVPGQQRKECKDCDCRKRCFFGFLSPESMRRFRADRRMRLYKAHQIVFNEGDEPQGIHILCVGEVKMTKSDGRGRELTLMYLLCGDLLGEVPYMGAEPYCASAETLRDSVVCFLHRDLVEHIREHEPEFSKRLLRRTSRFLCRCMHRSVAFAFQSADSRLAHFLLSLKNNPAPFPSCHAREPYSRREIADNLGLSPETVIRALSAFQRRGLIRLDGKKIAVADRAGLETVANLS